MVSSALWSLHLSGLSSALISPDFWFLQLFGLSCSLVSFWSDYPQLLTSVVFSSHWLLTPASMLSLCCSLLSPALLSLQLYGLFSPLVSAPLWYLQRPNLSKFLVTLATPSILFLQLSDFSNSLVSPIPQGGWAGHFLTQGFQTYSASAKLPSCHRSGWSPWSRSLLWSIRPSTTLLSGYCGFGGKARSCSCSKDLTFLALDTVDPSMPGTS